MRIALILLIGIHGMIHLFGFIKAFQISEFNSITQPISKTSGILWLLAFLLFTITVILILVRSDYWWLSGFLAVILSQVLILNYWSDTKFGSIANVIILFAMIIGYSGYNFKQKIKTERMRMFDNSQVKIQGIVKQEDLVGLPPIVQKWLAGSGIIDRQLISNVHLIQELELKLSPEQSHWTKGSAEQYFTVQPPAFNWNINTEMNAIWSVAGRDKFVDGKGEMLIKLLSLIPVAKAKNSEKTDQATLQRYLAEIVWFPSAALSPYITWKAIDDYSARAKMEYKGTKGSGEFHFNSDGTFKKFVAMRYQDANAAEPAEWTVVATKTAERNGLNIPVECEASWNLEGSKWTWLKLKIKHIDYNLAKIPIDKTEYR